MSSSEQRTVAAGILQVESTGTDGQADARCFRVLTG